MNDLGLLPKDTNETPNSFSQADLNTSLVPESPSPYEEFDSVYQFPTHNVQQKRLGFRERLLLLEDRQPVSQGTDILNYWKKLTGDEELSAVAAVVLAIPVTQVSIERSFSQLPLILSDHRTQMDSDTLRKMVIVKLNKFYFS